MPELFGKIAIWAWVVCVLWATAPLGGWRA